MITADPHTQRLHYCLYYKVIFFALIDCIGIPICLLAYSDPLFLCLSLELESLNDPHLMELKIMCLYY